MKPSIRILHLSDLHLSADAARRPDFRRWYQGLQEDIVSQWSKSDGEFHFIVVTGDITLSAKPAEFSAAADILGRLGRACKVAPREFVMVPGNHDLCIDGPSDDPLNNFREFERAFYSGSAEPGTGRRNFGECNLCFLTAPDSGAHRSLEAQDDLSLRVLVHHMPMRDTWASVARRVARDGTESPTPGSPPEYRTPEIQVVLHGHHHSKRLLQPSAVRSSTLVVGAGPLSCEGWRRARGGVATYNVITVTDGEVSVVSRMFLEAAERWVDWDSALLTEETPPWRVSSSHGLMVSPSSAPPQDGVLIDQVCSMPEAELNDLGKTLGAAIDWYSPVGESREHFASRLVCYFKESGALGLLERAMRGTSPTCAEPRIRVFIVSTAGGDKAARVLAERCERLGFGTWLSSRDLPRGRYWRDEVRRPLQAADIVLVLITDDWYESEAAKFELSQAMLSGSVGPKIVPIVVGGSRLPGHLDAYSCLRIGAMAEMQLEEVSQILRGATESTGAQRRQAVVSFFAGSATASARLALARRFMEVRHDLASSPAARVFQLKLGRVVRASDLAAVLEAEQCTVVHISGHGSGHSGVALLDSDGNEGQLGAAELREAFKSASGQLRIVILDGCYSKEQAEAISEVVPIVVCTTSGGQLKDSRAFFAQFYRSLGQGIPVRSAFENAVSFLSAVGADAISPLILCKIGADSAARLTEG